MEHREERGEERYNKKTPLINREEFIKLMHDSSKGGEKSIEEFFSSVDHVLRAGWHEWESCPFEECPKIKRIWRSFL